VLNESENIFTSDDGNLHFTKAIAEKENRVLHVVVNPAVSPKRIITCFLTEAYGAKYETKS